MDRVLGSVTIPTNAPRVGPSNWHDISNEVRSWRASFFVSRPSLTVLNRTINERIEYRGDGIGRDHWQGPQETSRLRAGDCEDFAILKMAELYALGVDPYDMIVVVGKLPDGRGHAVLTVRERNEWFVLDNLRSSAYRDADATMKPINGVGLMGKLAFLEVRPRKEVTT